MSRNWINENSMLSKRAVEILNEWKRHPQLIVQCKAIDAFPDIGESWFDCINPDWTNQDLEFRFKTPQIEVGKRYHFELVYDNICNTLTLNDTIYRFDNVLVDSLDCVSALVNVSGGNRIYADRLYPISKTFLPFYAIMNFTEME